MGCSTNYIKPGLVVPGNFCDHWSTTKWLIFLYEGVVSILIKYLVIYFSGEKQKEYNGLWTF